VEWTALFWLVLAVILIIFELETFNLVSIWFALGSVSAMIVSLFLPDWIWLQIIVFLFVSIVIIVTIRDLAIKKFKVGAIKTNVSSLIGRNVQVTTQIEPYKFGEVKVDGNYWTAKSEDGDIIPEGTIVEIVEISGVKLIVKPIKK
jgi:membrane protein implicated in regulation of membrane protease activity